MNDLKKHQRLTSKQVREIFRIPESSLKVFRWARRHNIPGYDFGPEFETCGRKVLYKPESVEKWLEQRNQQPEETA
jgi:hypothetical protein